MTYQNIIVGISKYFSQYMYSIYTTSLDILDMNLSNTACVSGISQSASSCTSGTLSSKASEGCAGGWWVPRNPEKKWYIQVYVTCHLYIEVYTCLYMVYTWYNPVICRCHTYGGYIRSKTFLGFFHTILYNDIPLILFEYQKNIHGISKVYHYKKGMEQTQKCFTTNIPTICTTSTYE